MALVAVLLTALAGCGGGKRLGESCRLSDNNTSDPCGGETFCFISEGCQEGSTTCTGSCQVKCPSGPDPVCGGGLHCDCNFFSGCACLAADGGS